MGVRAIAGFVFLSGLLTAGALVGCQTREFYPVTPLAISAADAVTVVLGKQLPPNIMLVVDRSGSMLESATGTGLACSLDGTTGTAYDPRSTNACKWNDLKTAFADPATGFLTTSKGLARFGLLPFPASTGACETGKIVVPIGDDPQPIRDQLLNRLTPGGGTPTAASVRAAAQEPALFVEEPNRRRFLMLLTDGLPNCNPINANKCAQCRADPASCQSATGCRPTEPPTTTCSPAPFDGATCLDEDELVSAVASLRTMGVDTFVIGFGKDTTGSDANRVLDRVADAGGQPREGAPVRYYQANSVQELRTFLEEILRVFPCTWRIDPVPADPMLVQMSIADSTAAGEIDLVRDVDWRFTANGLGEVQLLGTWCDTLQQADPNRYSVHVRYVMKLDEMPR